MVFMPPQNGKTELVSRRFPAYALGRKPDLKIVAASYSFDLAADVSRDVQRIMDGEAYRAVFPETRLATGKDAEIRTGHHFEVVGRRGSYYCDGIMGSLTGKTADLAIIDDPIKNRLEAESEVYRKRVWEQFVTSFHSRQFGANVPIVLCQTRWHEDDLAGRLLTLAQNDPLADQWVIVNLPAISERVQPNDPRNAGEPLWPGKYPLTDLLKRKAIVGAYNWSALYQQTPTPAEGGLIKRGWWKWYDPFEALNGSSARGTRPKVTEIVISVDTALKSKEKNDYAAIGVWGYAQPNAYGLKARRGRWDLPELIRQILDLHAWCKELWPRIMPMVLVENAGAGPDAVAELRHKIPGVMAEKPKGEKIQRLHAVLPMIEAGNVWLPGRSTADGRVDVGLRDTPSWVSEFVEECASFPVGTNDDQVDQMTQALRRLHRPRTYGGADLAGF